MRPQSTYGHLAIMKAAALAAQAPHPHYPLMSHCASFPWLCLTCLAPKIQVLTALSACTHNKMQSSRAMWHLLLSKFYDAQHACVSRAGGQLHCHPAWIALCIFISHVASDTDWL